MKKKNFITLSVIFLLLIGCSKTGDSNEHQVVNSTEFTVSIFSEKYEFENLNPEQSIFLTYYANYTDKSTYPQINISTFWSGKVVFLYKGKYYEETSFSEQSILNEQAYVLGYEGTLKSGGKHNVYSFHITEDYILSLPEVEMLTEN